MVYNRSGRDVREMNLLGQGKSEKERARKYGERGEGVTIIKPIRAAVMGHNEASISIGNDP